MNTSPVAFIVFNRPSLTLQTFAALRKQQPRELFIIADGPRRGHATDAERCRQVREIVADIDWPCQVHRNYADENLGCRQRVISGLDWVFNHVDTAIVLEDDCLPHPDFYTFCDTLLDRYRDDERVWVITGNNFQNGRWRGDASYYFSRFNHCWGWATWKRAWKNNEPPITFWPDWKQSAAWKQLWPKKRERAYWERIFDKMYRNEIDSWAYTWTASAWYHGGLTATPNVNLVSNIGFGPDATHTRTDSALSNLTTAALGNLSHPSVVQADLKADEFAYGYAFRGRNQGIKHRIRRLATKFDRACQRVSHRLHSLASAPRSAYRWKNG